MLFNSVEFLPFLLAVLALHYLLLPPRAERGRRIVLVLASYGFYMSWSPPFGLLLLFSTLLDHSVSRGLARARPPALRRALLGASLLGNLGVLGYFKYGDFLEENLHLLAGGLLGAAGPPPARDIVLPIGISFYTFQTLSYTIDVYRGRQAPTRSLLDFALYVSFFPQLVAGPIVRARDFLPQLAQRAAPGSRTPAPRDVERALVRIATGLVKKVVFADTLGAYVDAVFAFPEAQPGANALLGVYAYAFQIYFDFSGYSDMAIGLARLFGFRIPENFERPYLAADPREFWRRWHISLSTWLRDYVYIPLGGGRRRPLRVRANLVVTMLLGGLWHGAAWTFVLWGAYHAALLVAQRALAGTPLGAVRRLPLWLRRVLTFHLVCAGWVLFRAPSLDGALLVLGRLAEPGYEPSLLAGRALFVLALAVALHAGTSVAGLRRSYVSLPAWAQGAGYALMAALVFLSAPATQPFIYFQF